MTSDPLSRESVVALAQSLIRIPSVSGDEKAIMGWVQEWAGQHGIHCDVIARDPERPNLILSVGNPESGPVLCMNGHLDTVPVSDPETWNAGPFDPVISADGTKLFGRGSSDMKSSVAVMLSVLLAFRDVPLKGCLQAHVVSDEELSANFGTIVVLDAIARGEIRPAGLLPDWREE